MTQEQLARQMHSVVYAQRKLSYLKEKLEELLAQDPLMLAADQRTLSAANVETAALHEDRINEAKDEIEQEESAMQRLTDELLAKLPEIIKKLIREGMPLVAQWQMDGIESLALVHEGDKFRIIPDNKLA